MLSGTDGVPIVAPPTQCPSTSSPVDDGSQAVIEWTPPPIATSNAVETARSEPMCTPSMKTFTVPPDGVPLITCNALDPASACGVSASAGVASGTHIASNATTTRSEARLRCILGHRNATVAGTFTDPPQNETRDSGVE